MSRVCVRRGDAQERAEQAQRPRGRSRVLVFREPPERRERGGRALRGGGDTA